MAESEIISTGRRRIARPGKTPHPASSRSASKKPNGWASRTKNTRWKILERGRHLQVEDVERIAEIKRARAARTVNHRK
jgi:hypothetical protein